MQSIRSFKIIRKCRWIRICSSVRHVTAKKFWTLGKNQNMQNTLRVVDVLKMSAQNAKITGILERLVTRRQEKVTKNWTTCCSIIVRNAASCSNSWKVALMSSVITADTRSAGCAVLITTHVFTISCEWVVRWSIWLSSSILNQNACVHS